MQCVILMGIPATGKSTFCKTHLFRTHLRLNLDMLRSRQREWVLFEAALQTQTAVVIDNTNVNKAARQRYIIPAQAAGYEVIGYYFQSILADAQARNALRHESERVPAAAVGGISANLELPTLDEGFDKLYYVALRAEGGFIIDDWNENL